MANKIEQYSLLISCPGDVTEAIDIIKEVVYEFNQNYSDTLGIGIICKYWKDSAYAESGGKPQDLLNKQIVKPSDLAVAVFKNRFGSPTDKYGSGTEEEIEEMLSAGKQVFLFFDESPVKITDVDRDEYDKVLKFKEKYQKDKGIYVPFANYNEFKDAFRSHITKYFIKQIMQKDENKDPKGLTEHDKTVHERISLDMERFKDMVYGDIERLDPFYLDDFRFIDDLLDFSKRTANHFVDTSMESLRKALFKSIQDFRHYQAYHTFILPGTSIYSTTFYLIENHPEKIIGTNLPNVLILDSDTYKEKIQPYEEESREYREKAKYVVECFEEMEKKYLSLVN